MTVETDPQRDLSKEIDRLNEALKQLSFQNQMMLNWVNGSVITVDKDGNVLHANEIALKDAGLTHEELVGRQMHETMQHSQDDGSEYPWEFSPIFAAIEDGSSHHVDGEVFWHKDGSSFKVDYIVSPTRDERNEVIGAVIIFRNLTSQALIEAKRIHGMKLESIGVLSAGIAHEINTPIQFIGNNISFLRESFSDMVEILHAYIEFGKMLREEGIHENILDEIDELMASVDVEYLQDEAPVAFDQTQEGVERVTQLVRGLKGLAHSNSNETKAPTEMNEVINNALIVCQNAYKYVADLETDLQEIPHISAFGGDIGQVIVNLIVNAAHAIEEKNKKTGERGVISIKSFQENGEIMVQIGDTGSGIPMRLRERIFDPFFTTKDVGKGSGQGLAISRTIIHEKHNGELSFESTVGERTVFTIRLPIA